MRARVAIALAVLGACRREPPPAPAPAAAPARPPDARSGAADVSLSAAERAEAEVLVAAACVGCHGQGMLAQQRLTVKQWETVIKKMQAWGSPLDAAHAGSAARFLAERHAPDGPPNAAASVPPAQAARALEPLPDGPLAGGDATAGKVVYGRSCAACHGADARGGPLGVNLVDRLILWRAPELLAVVQQGRGRMPGFPLPERDVASVMAYLRGVR
jgi:mono/diheme cytochrome c family protein